MNAQGGVLQTLLREHCEALHAVACHPQQPVVAMGSHSGILKVWDYERKVSICSRVFEKERHIQCIAYDPQGDPAEAFFCLFNFLYSKTIFIRRKISHFLKFKLWCMDNSP